MKILINGNTWTEIIRDKEILSIDRWIGNLDKNKYKRLVIVLALVIPSTTLNIFADSEIINTGVFFYQYVKDVAYVICLLGGAVEGMKCVLSGTTESIGKVGIKYLSFALIIKFLPKVVGTIFNM
ncbi:MAG TPA: hypothetical protein DDY58_07685 [Terrisporobacter glycolicus]|uniref:hypothetical protein n=1 Tax=Terrisporobacter TaxID=1505652 RepID=UPI000E919E4A|nr:MULTISPECIES: hypothetical protein [Terrisporobacter]HBI92314.1 hypothetical protein [Terrisporobacter hibernicus]